MQVSSLSFPANDTRRSEGEREECRTEMVPGTDGDVEVALCLTLPQTADVALIRLALEAPTAAGSGEYDTVALLSRDCQGLLPTPGLHDNRLR